MLTNGLPAEQEPDGFAHRVCNEPDESDEREDRDARERLVRLHDEDRHERSDDERGCRKGSPGHGPDGEPDEEDGPEHDDAKHHAARVGPASDGADRQPHLRGAIRSLLE